MSILDNPEKIKEIDKEGMLETEEKFYQQMLDAKEIADGADLGNIKGKDFEGVAFSGMGGSGFAGDIIKALIKDDINIPVEVVKGYNLPSFVKSGWLVVPVSYSGNTEETISAASKALDRGCEILIVCSGGELESIARSNNKTIIKIPSGLQPRGAIGYLFFPAYLALDHLDIMKIPSGDIEETLDLIKEKAGLYNREVSSDKNFAKKIALKISDNLPIVYGTEGLLSAVAYRLKCEFNENSKTPCWWNEFPELNHNETVGWERLKGTTRKFVLLVFREKNEGIRIKTRIDVTLNLIRENVSEVIEIPVEGKSKLAKVLSTMYLGDIVSVYLALLAGIDPGPVEKIQSLKAELSKLN
ncbi:MAG: bifunctional phosphoglucose/phosphomannose isomerase [Actinobacteria bacterium]|nr:bifunctional phosphoglucose/phosphomannose isomerase [Actinomycetota bacterium]